MHATLCVCVCVSCYLIELALEAARLEHDAGQVNEHRRQQQRCFNGIVVEVNFTFEDESNIWWY